jgi:DNA-directed RNA polymerase specialized sigma24 family protein
MDDLQAIRRLKEGDIGGLEVLVARYQRKAVQTAYLITHDEQLAEDVAQETFVRIHQRIPIFCAAWPMRPLTQPKKPRAGCSLGPGLTSRQ